MDAEGTTRPAGGDATEEQRLILRMVEQGKITPEQGVELLRALTVRPSPVGAPGDAPPAGEPPEEKGDFVKWTEAVAGRMSQLADELSERVQASFRPGSGFEERMGEVGERLEQLGRSLADKLSQSFGQLGRARFPTQTLTEERTGEFDEGALPEVDLTTRHGTIRIEGSAGTAPRAWRLTVRRNVKARTREEAEILGARLMTVEQGPARLSAKSDESGWEFGFVDLELVLSPDLAVQLRAGSRNGAVQARGVTARAAELQSSNGRIDVADLQAEHVHAVTQNGAIVLERVRAASVHAESINGSVTGVVEAADIKATSTNGVVTIRPVGAEARTQRVAARTSNGSARVVLPPALRDAIQRQELGARLEASSTWGSARVDVPGVTLVHQTSQTSRHHLIYQSRFDESERTLVVEAETKNGSATISAE